jgi:hypothetical protein
MKPLTQIEILEQAIKICKDYSEDKYNLYKGRAPYTGKEYGRANDIVQGQSNGVSGSFTFGTGTVESKPVYYFAFKVADKICRIDKVSGDIVFTLDNPQQPYIETVYSKQTRIDTDSIGYKYFVTDVFNISKEKVSYNIHLPETAIQQAYNAMPN